jgi:hypothetical protein
VASSLTSFCSYFIPIKEEASFLRFYTSLPFFFLELPATEPFPWLSEFQKEEYLAS